MKLPYFPFYPGDWLRDQVSGCSLAAQGLWLRMLILMHDSENYGYLSLNGVPIPPESIARRCGCPLEQYTTLLQELTVAAVVRVTEHGILYSKRMVVDAKARSSVADRKRKERERRKKGGEPK
jgi:hypothetical protein